MILKKILLLIFSFCLLTKTFSQEICFQWRTKPESQECFTINDYIVKTPTRYDLPRLYQIRYDSSYKISRIRITLLDSNDMIIDKREISYDQNSSNNSFEYNDNAKMGPYMKSNIDYSLKIEMIVYKKEEQWVRLPIEKTTFNVTVCKKK